jgi:hypothetical protein
MPHRNNDSVQKNLCSQTVQKAETRNVTFVVLLEYLSAPSAGIRNRHYLIVHDSIVDFTYGLLSSQPISNI